MISNGRVAGAGLLTIAAVGTLGLWSGPGHSEEALECLARTLYFEARNEGQAGMDAVAAVVFNRIESPEFPDDVCNVVKDGGESPPCQFAWWCDGKSDQPDDPDLWRAAEEVAARWLDSPPPDPVADALYFHARGADAPYHKEELELVEEVGDHLFYR